MRGQGVVRVRVKVRVRVRVRVRVKCASIGTLSFSHLTLVGI